MSAPSWMPLYIGNYLADTGHLTTVEHGAYMLLIMHYWQHSGLPDDDRKLARICRMTPDEWEAARDTLADFFDDGWVHGRIDREIATACETMNKRSAAGKHAASVRHANRMRSAVQTHTPAGIGQGSDLESSETVVEEDFTRASEPKARMEFGQVFWPEWPHRVGQRAAVEAFIAARRKASLDAIMDGVRRYKSTKPPDRQWMNPSTFLDEERWTDEPAPNDSKPKPHDAIFEALARRASAGGRDDERPADATVRVLDYRGPAAGTGSVDSGISRTSDAGRR